MNTYFTYYGNIVVQMNPIQNIHLMFYKSNFLSFIARKIFRFLFFLLNITPTISLSPLNKATGLWGERGNVYYTVFSLIHVLTPVFFFIQWTDSSTAGPLSRASPPGLSGRRLRGHQ